MISEPSSELNSDHPSWQDWCPEVPHLHPVLMIPALGVRGLLEDFLYHVFRHGNCRPPESPLPWPSGILFLTGVPLSPYFPSHWAVRQIRVMVTTDCAFWWLVFSATCQFRRHQVPMKLGFYESEYYCRWISTYKDVNQIGWPLTGKLPSRHIHVHTNEALVELSSSF